MDVAGCGGGSGDGAAEFMQIRLNHRHNPKENQCSSVLVKHIDAPVHLVWSLVRRFDQPQKYKPFVSRCVMKGDLGIGSVREVDVKSGLPATTSTEILELLDDNEHILATLLQETLTLRLLYQVRLCGLRSIGEIYAMKKLKYEFRMQYVMDIYCHYVVPLQLGTVTSEA